MWDELESILIKNTWSLIYHMEFESELHEFFNDEKEYSPNTKGNT
jgi:hypothetical protein